MREKKYSFCRNCAANCGIEFEVENRSIVSHRSDRANLLSRGFMCIKGDMSVGLHTGQEPRLLSAQKRTQSGFEHVANEAMMDDVARRLGDLLRRHGPRSVATFYGTCAYQKSLNIPMAKEFMAKIGSPNVFSTMTIDQSAHWVALGRMGVFATGRPYMQDTDCIVLSGMNPMISHGSVFTALPNTNIRQHIRELQPRGGKLVVIDPRVTETAQLADIRLQPRPGFDADIFAALIRLVLANGWHDPEFCERFVSGVEALRSVVDPFTPEFVAARAGVDAQDLVRIAEVLSRSRRPSISFGTGTSMARHPDTAAHLIYALNALCGGYARAGDVVRNPGVFFPKATVEQVYPPSRTWERDPKLSTGHGALYGEFPSSQLVSEILRQDEGRIRALIVVGGNIALALGSPDRVRAALGSLELLVVVDPRMTETARHAHYVVAPPLQYEVHDISPFTDITSINPFVQVVEPIQDPPPDTLEEWRFFHGIAQRLGKELELKPFAFGQDAAAQHAGLKLTEDRDWSTRDMVDWLCRRAGLDVDAARSSQHGYCPTTDLPVIGASPNDDGMRLELCPADVADEVAQIIADELPDQRKYSLVSRRIVETYNSAFRESPITRQRHATNVLYMHPLDMSEESLVDGDRVAIEGRHGAIVGYLKSDSGMRRRVVSMTHCWGVNDIAEDPLGMRGAHTGRLVSLDTDEVQPIDGMPLQSGIPVDIKRHSL